MTEASALPEVDPVTFEVIKHRLWQINDEQSIAIRTISSSPIVVEGNDFNVGLFSEDGQVTTAGIGSLVHVGTIGDALKSIMRGVGKIRDGDIFLTNDPFLGALHQNDVVLASPLFYDGGALHCRRCGERLSGADGRVAVSERPLSAASPWMAPRHLGDGPNFVLEEVSCPSCATLFGVREVRRNGGKG